MKLPLKRWSNEKAKDPLKFIICKNMSTEEKLKNNQGRFSRRLGFFPGNMYIASSNSLESKIERDLQLRYEHCVPHRFLL